LGNPEGKRNVVGENRERKQEPVGKRDRVDCHTYASQEKRKEPHEGSLVLSETRFKKKSDLLTKGGPKNGGERRVPQGSQEGLGKWESGR